MYHQMNCQLDAVGGFPKFFRGPGVIFGACLGSSLGSVGVSGMVFGFLRW